MKQPVFRPPRIADLEKLNRYTTLPVLLDLLKRAIMGAAVMF